MQIYKYCLLFSLLFLSISITFSQSKEIIRSDLVRPEVLRSSLMKNKTSTDLKIGLVLSGGGARGIAQVGVLKVLEEYKIPIDLIVGNSMGAIVGGLYAAGYSATELESIALHTNWTEALSLTEETKRSELFLDQKHARDKSFLVVRFNALQPIIPSAISGGQRITNVLSKLALQALYHPNPTFDELKIPFRAVASDIITGEKYIFDRGSLSEAMRASMTVPMLFTPLEKDSLSLVDGGLVSNIPVDIAKSLGCDFVIAVNSTGELRKLNEFSAPWEVADQIMTIMMAFPNKEQLKMADVVIKPDIGDYAGSDFEDIKFLIDKGVESAKSKIDDIVRIINEKRKINNNNDTLQLKDYELIYNGDLITEDIRKELSINLHPEKFTREQLVSDINKIYNSGMYKDVFVELIKNGDHNQVIYNAEYYPETKKIVFNGNDVFPSEILFSHFSELLNKPLNRTYLDELIENLLHKYRQNGYSLARIDNLEYDFEKCAVEFKVYEGIIDRIKYVGNEKTAEFVLRREFAIEPGTIFQMSKIQQGISNISSTGLFEYVLFEINEDKSGKIELIVRVKEKPTDMIRFGLSANDERGLSINIDLRDGNFRGHGEELGLTLLTGLRDGLLQTEYQVYRIFHTYLTFNLKGYYQYKDIFTFQNIETRSNRRWNRDLFGEYRFIKYGGSISFGTQLEKFGNIRLEYRREQHKIREITSGGFSPEEYPIAIMKLSTTIDTKNVTPFTTEGMYYFVSYETAPRELGSKFSFTKLTFAYELYMTFSPRHTIRPKIFFGLADATVPLVEQYTLGGMNSFFGWREFDSRGRQIFIVNSEYRFKMPFKILYDTYFSLRYDIGTISGKSEELKLASMRHGLGVSIGLDTPIGPVRAAIGQGIFLPTKQGESISRGPVMFYFSFGYEI